MSATCPACGHTASEGCGCPPTPATETAARLGKVWMQTCESVQALHTAFAAIAPVVLTAVEPTRTANVVAHLERLRLAIGEMASAAGGISGPLIALVKALDEDPLKHGLTFDD